MTDNPLLLIADDQPDILDALRLLLKGEGFELVAVDSPAAVIRAVEEREFDTVLIDLNYTRDTTSGREGLDLLTVLQANDPALPVVVMTAWGSVESAVEAMRRGARDYIEKPWDNARLLTTLRTQVELGHALRRAARLESENLRLREDSRADGLPELIADSPAMQPVLRLIERVAPSDANVLITGEHGTGKEVIARRIHAASNRARRPLVAVNAGGLSEGVFESELFGHVRGAFTGATTDRVGYFELADGGTLLLDEIGTLPASQQAKLLRVLQSGELQRVGSSRTHEVDVRVIAATNVDINAEIDEGRFREDLLFRLNTVELHLPPLRDRTEDIPRLAAFFLGTAAHHYRKRLTGFTPDALRELAAHPSPGNVRELEHTIERAFLMASGDVIQVDDLALRTPRGGAGRLEELTLAEAEEYLIRRALERHDGNVSRAAEALGLSRSALYRRIEQYGIDSGG